MPSEPRAIGIIRVSQVKGRKGESFSSPKDQRAAIERFCTEHGWKLLAVHDELQVSGNALLEDRPGLSQAVTAIITGGAEIIIGAHSERLWWSHEVRAQVLRLVQGAGGEVWAVDTGRLSSGSAAENFSGEVRTSADRLSRLQNAEKSRTAVVRAVRRGVMPWANVPPGYERGKDGVLVPSADADVVRAAFTMRMDGATVQAVRDHLAGHGIHRAYSKVNGMTARGA
jgi:DNA invertase Pin-like site-specific DNA recombinase